jgi:hypothetical protein
VGDDSKPLGVRIAIVLAPPASKMLNRRLMNSAFTMANTDNGDTNVWAGYARDVSSVYLANSAMGGGYSATAWYALADPAEIPVIETCFLNGVEVPTIESTDMDLDRLGIAFRAFHDFGVKKQDYRGGFKMAGA